MTTSFYLYITIHTSTHVDSTYRGVPRISSVALGSGSHSQKTGSVTWG